jgi:AraC-like DNA-binding protein
MERPVSIEEVLLEIKGLLPKGHPTIDRAAEALGMSRRTLQRRLNEAGVTYGQLLDRCRIDAACKLLEDSKIRLRDVASELGYADPSSFSRFFVRSMGRTPRAYRRER